MASLIFWNHLKYWLKNFSHFRREKPQIQIAFSMNVVVVVIFLSFFHSQHCFNSSRLGRKLYRFHIWFSFYLKYYENDVCISHHLATFIIQTRNDFPSLELNINLFKPKQQGKSLHFDTINPNQMAIKTFFLRSPSPSIVTRCFYFSNRFARARHSFWYKFQLTFVTQKHIIQLRSHFWYRTRERKRKTF